MAFKIVLRGEEPSGRILALLCARTGDTIDRVRKYLQSQDGLTFREGLSREKADEILASLPADGSVEITVQRDVDSWVAVLMGYRPGSRGRLRVALQKMSKLSTEEIIHFLASIPVALKAGIPRETAESIKEILEREGGIVEIRPHTGLPLEETGNLNSEDARMPEESEEEEPGLIHQGPPGGKPDIPPRVEETRAAMKPVMNVEPPPVFSLAPPDKEAVSAPPYPRGKYAPADDAEIPYSFKFTIPGRPLPQKIISPDEDGPPGVTESAAAVPIYLHPVSPGQRDYVCRVLTEVLGMDGDRAMDLVQRAPVAIWACREKLNSLVTLRGLSERSVPVSLFPGSRNSADSAGDHSFFGWMNGNQ